MVLAAAFPGYWVKWTAVTGLLSSNFAPKVTVIQSKLTFWVSSQVSTQTQVPPDSDSSNCFYIAGWDEPSLGASHVSPDKREILEVEDNSR